MKVNFNAKLLIQTQSIPYYSLRNIQTEIKDTDIEKAFKSISYNGKIDYSRLTNFISELESLIKENTILDRLKGKHLERWRAIVEAYKCLTKAYLFSSRKYGNIDDETRASFYRSIYSNLSKFFDNGRFGYLDKKLRDFAYKTKDQGVYSSVIYHINKGTNRLAIAIQLSRFIANKLTPLSPEPNAQRTLFDNI